MYALKYVTECGLTDNLMKAKGVPRHLLQNQELFETYKSQLIGAQDQSFTFCKLEKRSFSVSLKTITRRGICAVDTKTFHYGEYCLPHGHFRNLEEQGCSIPNC